MATEIQYQSQLPQLLTQLLGSKQTSSSTPGVTAPLEELFTSAMGASKAGVPEMQQLIASIFQEGATKVPELSHAFANATGSRTTGNASLALALGDLNRQLSSQAAQAVLTNQTNNRQIAANAGSGIAQATRGASTTQTNKAGVNPLLLSLLGTGVNKLDKLGKLAWLKSGAMAPVVDGVAIPVGDITGSGMDSFPEFSQPFPDIGGAGDFGSVGTDVLAGAADSFGFGSDIGFDAAIPDFDFSFFDPGFGTGADFGSLDLGSFLFADGGHVGSKRVARRGAGGGVLNVDKNMSAMPPQYKELLFSLAGQHGFNPGEDMSKIISMFQQEAARAPTQGIAADMTQQQVLLQNLQNLIFNPGAYNSSSIFQGSAPRTVEQINGYADGGSPMQRNRNYMGTPTRVAPQIRANNVMPMRPRPQPVRQPGTNAADDANTGAGDATSVPSVVGDPATNNAAALGFAIAAMLGPVGIPGLTSVANAATGGKSLPSLAITNLLATLGLTGADNTGFVGEAQEGGMSVPGAPGSIGMSSVPGMQSNVSNDGLAGLGIGGQGTAAGGGTGPGGSGGSGSGVGADGSATSGVDGDSGVGSTGAYRDGGKVKGPGTGTSDSIPARLSDGEYVIPADVVRRIGTDALDRLISGHMPAGISLAGEEDEDD